MFRHSIGVFCLLLTGCASQPAATRHAHVSDGPHASAPPIAMLGSPLAPGVMTSWQTPNGRFNVEHLAGVTDDCRCVVYVRSPEHDWKAIDVTQITGQRVVGPLVSWQTTAGPYNVEHLAGRSPDGDLVVFWWSPRGDWQVVNVSHKTGERIADAPVVWQLADGAVNTENLAARSPAGDLLVFHWTPKTDWQVDNVSQQIGKPIHPGITHWLIPGDPVVEHLAAIGEDGSPYVFSRFKGRDWRSVNVAAPAPSAAQPVSLSGQ
jgi:hypothetical protein